MKFKFSIYFLIFSLCYTSYAQELDTIKLTKFFNTLEKRNEAMGSVAISKNGRLIYKKTIGFRYKDTIGKIPATTDTNYRIWSITKTYTAVMIFQLIEEGKLSLETPLSTFYPQIPNANTITIKQMLAHRSGIFDYVNDTNEEAKLDTTSRTNHKTSLIQHIAKFKPNFNPGEDFRYSNSNYFLLGCIVEGLDENTFEVSLANRIVHKIHLKSTYFGRDTLKSINNKANTYYFDKQWRTSPEEENYRYHLETADGGIVSTPKDMALFIDALFDEKLVSKESLNLMTAGADFYRLGLMKTQFEDMEGFGHTGGWISESSLFHYPNEKLTIAYTSNGPVLRTEDILNNILKIYHQKSFDISMDRKLQLSWITGCFLLIIFAMRRFTKFDVLNNISLRLGLVIAFLFWTSTFIASMMLDNYSHRIHGITELDAFYSNSGTFTAGMNMSIALLTFSFILGLSNACKKHGLNRVPLIPLIIIPISLLGSMLTPFPNNLYSLFINVIILSSLSPLLASILWRGKHYNLRWAGISCFLCMLVSMGLLISRPKYPQLIAENFGFIQRILFLGWTLWLVVLSLFFIKSSKNETAFVRDSD